MSTVTVPKQHSCKGAHHTSSSRGRMFPAQNVGYRSLAVSPNLTEGINRGLAPREQYLCGSRLYHLEPPTARGSHQCAVFSLRTPSRPPRAETPTRAKRPASLRPVQVLSRKLPHKLFTSSPVVLQHPKNILKNMNQLYIIDTIYMVANNGLGAVAKGLDRHGPHLRRVTAISTACLRHCSTCCIDM